MRVLVMELALACLEGAALAHALMSLQEVADESEARATEAVAAASDPAADVAAMDAAIEAATTFAQAERAEFAAATRWATHVTETRQLARRALRMASASGSEAARWPSGPARERR